MHGSIYIVDIEAAINHWRSLTQVQPASGTKLGSEVRALATVYGSMIYHHQHWVDAGTMPEPAYQAWLTWYATTPDTPCIAICSTSQGDAFCKGCGRSAAEVQGWVSYTPAQKRMAWHRIQAEGTAWRFNRYAERC